MLMSISPFSLLGGLFLGWSAGRNDFANLFGTAIASKMVRVWQAVLLASIFCMTGACLSGYNGIETLANLSRGDSVQSAVVTSLAAAATITLMNRLKIPVSASQAVVGSIVGTGLMAGTFSFQESGLTKIVLCWLLSPALAFIISCAVYLAAAKVYNSCKMNIFQRDRFLRWGLILVGCYASYAFGANISANVAAVFVGSGAMTAQTAVIFGGACLVLGITTFSRGVLNTVGRGIVKLDAFSALVAVFCEATTVLIFALLGVPISTMFALVGAIVGIGVVRSKTIRFNKLLAIGGGWFAVPAVSCLLSALFFFISHLKYLGP